MITIDFETEAIEGNPLVTPPKPVGVAIWAEGEQPFYTDDWDVLCRYWSAGLKEGMLFHNSQFDLAVGTEHLNLPYPDWTKVHDTMYPIFFADPYAQTLSLKPSAERYLNEPPEEQNELHDWILANVPEATKKTAGAYISRAPWELVEPYAIGDVTRTRGLFDYLRGRTPTEPYDRERRLSPVLVDGTQRGIRIDRERLGEDIEVYEKARATARQMMVKYLQCPEEINFDSGEQLAEALERRGLVKEWILTPTGKRSTSRPNLLKCLKDAYLLDLMAYHSILGTCIGTFMLPWYEMSRTDGRVHPEWNQVRDTDRGGYGTRTGRLSSSRPNFQNPPNPFETPPPAGLPPLPAMRSYCLPEPGHVWVKRDFSSQEIRILAHFEDGELCRLYNEDPDFDPHEKARQDIYGITNNLYERLTIKRTAFGIIYGMGIPALTESLNVPKSEATQIKSSYLRVNPGVSDLSRLTKSRGDHNEGIRTWGGRHYMVEPPKIIKGRMRTFGYKLLNYLIQGSAADQTKQCLSDWYYDYKSKDDTFVATVHDEINISVPAEEVERGMKDLQRAMEQPLFDVPMRSDGFIGPNWGDIEKE